MLFRLISISTWLSMGEMDKTFFLGGFDPLDFSATGGFFSQIVHLVNVIVCSDFEENRRGRPINRNISITYNFFPI